MLERLIDTLGDQWVLALGGLVVGVLFGAFAQYSRFCLRAATLEIAHGVLGERMAIWLFTFSTALIVTQALILLDLFDTGAVRQLNNTGSLSGAIIGGLMFGCGMTLTRACGSRMLVLSATGNLRALLSGLVFAVVAQMSRDGLLSPARAAINGWWTIDSSARDLLALFRIGNVGGLAFALLWLVAGAAIAMRSKTRISYAVAAVGVGLMVGAAWWFNFHMASVSFEMAPVHSISFTSPSADTLMYVLAPPGSKVTFDLGLIPGVFLGAFVSGALNGDLKLEGFHDGSSMRRYIAGGCLMGFGGVLAGGCAVGAGVSGASIFAMTAWLVLWSMWIGAVVTDRLVDQPKAKAAYATA
jgi:uncharacterized membrane protein YedE/YeeE